MQEQLVNISLITRKIKGYRFYCRNHSMRILEIGKALFIENGKISWITFPWNVEIIEIGVQVPLTCASSSKVSVSLHVVPNNNEEK